MKPMRAPPLWRLREWLHYDPESGAFSRVASARKCGTVDSKGYLKIQIDGVIYLAHRLAWLYMTCEWPTHLIDHIDTDPLNNRWANLRAATTASNAQNQRMPHINNCSGYLGVAPVGGKFCAQIKVRGKTRHLGRFDQAADAHAAYVAAKRQLHASSTL